MRLQLKHLVVAAIGLAAPSRVQAFFKGINQPWGNGHYGTWLSSSYQGWSAVYNEQDVINTFAAAQDIGAAWVRIWLFENAQGLTYDSNNRVTGIKSDFTTNFNNLLGHAGTYGIKVLPTFFNYPPGTSDFPLANFFTDSTAQSMLMNNLILPFTRTYGGNGNIAGFQLYNELNGIANPYFSGYVINQATAKAWVTSVTSAIHSINSGVKVSVSQIMISDSYHPVGTSNLDYQGTGVDYYDIHIYSDNGMEIPTASAFNLDKPVYLGEFGELTGEGDQHQADVIYNFFVAAKAGGYATAWYWSLGWKGDNQADECGSDSTIKYTLFNCEGNPRQGYNEFKYS